MTFADNSLLVNLNSAAMPLSAAIERNISDAEIQQAGAHASIIEDYPDDKYAPSSLLLGFTVTGRPIHIQASHVDSDLLKIITIYEPDPTEWYDYARRR